MGFTFRSKNITEKNPSVYDVRNEPFSIHGLWHPERQGIFRRMPEEVAAKTSKRVHTLHTNTSGARLRFSTDSSFIALGAVYPSMTFPSERTAALSGASAFCFDLYSDGEHICVMFPQSIRQNGSVVSFDIGDGRYESCISFPERKLREINLCFPSFVDISELYVGLEKGAAVNAAARYKNDRPVVFYGSSITQGACASRSGNIYQNILSRRLGFDYINLGFAGGCLAEDAVIDYLCTLDAPLLVFDYDHNTPSVEYLKKTHLSALRKIRSARPEMPIILMSKPNLQNGRAVTLERMKVIENSYKVLSAESDAPIHFINGLEVFESADSEMMTVDGTHPTDLGFYCIASALYSYFKLYL